jgi:hypothetical protein
MRNLTLFGVLSLCLLVPSYARAERFAVGIGVGPAYVGPPPVCPYGYYGYYPYACAPYGYYGPSWFSGGIFIGAGPWFNGFHARPGFYGRGYWRGPIDRGPGYYGRGAFHGGYHHYDAGGGFHEAVRHGYAHGDSARGGYRGGGRR